jgi:hypothetical protein
MLPEWGRIYLVLVAGLFWQLWFLETIKDMGGRIDDAFGVSGRFYYQWQLPVLSYSPL